MTEHPNEMDYANRAERNAAYWREDAAMMIEGSSERCRANELADEWLDVLEWYEALANG